MDAPSVLGPTEPGARSRPTYGLALVRMGLETVMEAGLIERQPVEPLAHLMLGRAGRGRADDRARGRSAEARQEVGESVERLLEGLRVR